MLVGGELNYEGHPSYTLPRWRRRCVLLHNPALAVIVLITGGSCSFPSSPGILPLLLWEKTEVLVGGASNFPTGTLLPGPRSLSLVYQILGPSRRETETEKQGSTFHFLSAFPSASGTSDRFSRILKHILTQRR